MVLAASPVQQLQSDSNQSSTLKNQPKGPWNGPYGQTQQQQQQNMATPNFYVSSSGIGFKQLQKPEDEGKPFNINLLKEIADPSETKGHMRQPSSPRRQNSSKKSLSQSLSSSLSVDSAQLISNETSALYKKQDMDAKKLIHEEQKNYQNKTENFNNPLGAPKSKKGTNNYNLKKDKKMNQPRPGY